MRHKLKQIYWLLGFIVAIFFGAGLIVSKAYALSPTCTWTGSGDGIHWNSAANWSCTSGTVPVSGDNLIFNVGTLTSQANLINNISNLALQNVSITGTSALYSFNFSGNSISLASGITDNSDSFNTWSMAITLTASQTFSITNGAIDDLSGSTLTIGSNTLNITGTDPLDVADAIVGSGTINDSTSGTVFFDENSPSLTGPINLSSGALLIVNVSTPTALGSGLVSVASGATLQESINATGTYTVSNPLELGGSGKSGSGQLDVHVFSGGTSTINYTGNVILGSNSSVSLEGANANINGNVYGCNHTISEVGGSSGTLGGNLTGSCTQTPTLSSPVSNTTYDFIPVSFNLPETPGSGTVTLILSGPVTETLNLNVTSAGTTSFTLNPKSLLSSAFVSSVSPPASSIPDGTYAITLAYQDIAFSPAASVTANNVIINTSAGGVSINNLTPSNNSSNVSLNPVLTFTFNQPMSIGSGNIVVHKLADSSVIESIPVSGGSVSGGGTNTISVTLTSALTNGTTYYVTIDPGAFTNQSGNSFAGISSSSIWQFTTAALPIFSDPASVTTVATPDTGYGSPHKNVNLVILILVASTVLLILGFSVIYKAKSLD